MRIIAKTINSTAKIFNSPNPILSGLMIGINLVGRVGFEPTKAQGQQIYSLPQLTALVSTLKI